MDKRCKKCGEVKPASDFHKNGAHGLRARCKHCENERYRQRDSVNRPARKQNNRIVTANPEKPPRQTLTAEEAAKRNREKVKAWKAANPDREKERQRRYLEKNRDKVRAKWSKRRADRLQATPPWADLVAIAAVYAEAARLTRETGVEHHVDHIIPLRGRSACGLHVHWNLRPIPAAENASKLNREVDVDGVEYFKA